MKAIKTLLVLVLAVSLAVLLKATALSENLCGSGPNVGSTLAALAFWGAGTTVVLAAAAWIGRIWRRE